VRSLRLAGYCEITAGSRFQIGARTVGKPEDGRQGRRLIAFNGRLLQDRPRVGTGPDRRAEKAANPDLEKAILRTVTRRFIEEIPIASQVHGCLPVASMPRLTNRVAMRALGRHE
jgi:hypothetical protein